MGQAIRELEAMAATVPLETPWTAGQALDWDSQTVETWLQARVSSERVRTWLREIIRGTLAAEARDASLLHALFYIRSAGGMAVLIGTGGGAQERRFHQGAQAISIRLAETLGDRVVLGAPAEVVRHGEGGVAVEAAGRTVTGGRAILTMPPATAGRIGYRPALPGWRNQLTQRVPMGIVIKLHAVYGEPFWRHEGLSGFAISDCGPVSVVYDDSPETGSPGVLVGFIEGEHARTWARRSPADRRAGVLARLTDIFGEPAARPRELLERCWADEEYSGGCYGGYFPPGVWTSYGQALREPVGRLHWAGTETATDWTSFMEGAVQSGERAADEVLAAGWP
jgi:monoamine oxidase